MLYIEGLDVLIIYLKCKAWEVEWGGTVVVKSGHGWGHVKPMAGSTLNLQTTQPERFTTS